jgi:acetoin utilization deacetylase AcuC-like enzyme
MDLATAARIAMSIALVSNSDCGRHDTGWGHPEHVGRLRAIPRALREEPELYSRILHVESRHATEDELAFAHDRAYIASVRDIAAQGGGRLDADTVASEGSWDAATAGAGAVLDAIDMAFGDGPPRSFCAVRPPGHHALRSAAMGFCVFGNVGIGAHYARRRHGAERVLIVDWDVHHGNGTQAFVEEERDIHFVSMHQWPWYPGTGAAEDRGPHRNVWNVPMRANLPPDTYVDALRSAIDAATADFSPDLVMISAGFDSLRGDPLGAFTLELEHVEALTRFVVERAEHWCDGRVVSALAGGYDPERLAAACVRHMHALESVVAGLDNRHPAVYHGQNTIFMSIYHDKTTRFGGGTRSGLLGTRGPGTTRASDHASRRNEV